MGGKAKIFSLISSCVRCMISKGFGFRFKRTICHLKDRLVVRDV